MGLRCQYWILGEICLLSLVKKSPILSPKNSSPFFSKKEFSPPFFSKKKLAPPCQWSRTGYPMKGAMNFEVYLERFDLLALVIEDSRTKIMNKNLPLTSPKHQNDHVVRQFGIFESAEHDIT